MTQTVTHTGFSDESNWNTGRFRSLALVTLPLDALADHQNQLRQHLAESKIREFKWKKLSGARERFAALRMIDFAIQQALAQRLRIDVLVWDIEDRRHRVHKRDDVENLKRMYFHLFQNVLRARWPQDSVWRLYPDEHTAIDWGELHTYLDAASIRTTTATPSLFEKTKGAFRVQIYQAFNITEIRSVKSHQQPLLQLADLFAGLAVFSRTHFDEYQTWKRNNSGQLSLPLEAEQASGELSRSTRERLPVLHRLKQKCQQHRLGVSLNKQRGLWTPNPKKPINFWFYKPQHPEDKAPTRGSKT